MILSFAWTTDTLLAGRKTCTRRQWTTNYHRRWANAWDNGRRIHQAWNKSPRAGGRKVGDIELSCRPYRERLADMPERDLEAEGGLWASREEFVELFGGSPHLVVSVVRFILTNVEPGDYPASWPEIAESIKTAAGWRCEHCDHPNDRVNGYVLTVHHLNGNPADCRHENLVALCQRCHLSIQAKYKPGQQVLPGFEVPAWMSERGLTLR